jgi:PAS domain S-box-containing protein
VLPDFLLDRAVLYVSGEMPAADRDAFDVLLEYQDELRSHVVGMQEIVAAGLAGRARLPVLPPAELKSRILAGLSAPPPRPEPEALVVTTADGRLEWVNAAFTALCGHTLPELKGRKPGEVLQGPGTDPAAVERIRQAVRAGRPCRETLLNYHKDGTSYRADIRIMPVRDDDGRPLWFVARERRVPEGENRQRF